MAISAEQLNIILSAKDKEFTRAMDRSQRRVERFAKQSNKNLSKTSSSFNKMAGAVTAVAAALSGAAMVNSLRNVTQKLDDIGKTADQIGITTDALQELRTVAESSGVTQDELDKSIEKLGKGLAEAAMGLGTAKDGLKTLGLNAQELIDMGLENALGAIATEVNKLPSPMEKTATATQLFGRSGAPMLNLLREGADGMATMREEARRLGVVIDETLIRDAEAAQDKLDLLARVIDADMSSALIKLAPLLTSASSGIASLAEIAGNTFTAFQQLFSSEILPGTQSRLFQDISRDIEKYEHLIETASRKRSELLEGAKGDNGQTDLGLLSDRDMGRLNMYQEKMQEARQKLSVLRAELAALQSDEPQTDPNQAAKDLETAGQNALSIAMRRTEELKEQARLREIGAEAAERERIETEKQALISKMLDPYVKAGTLDELPMVREEAIRVGEAFEQASIAASTILNPVKAVKIVTEEIRTEAELAREAYVQMLNDMIKASPALQQLGFDAQILEDTMSVVQDSMESAFMSMIDGTMSAKDAFKSMAADIIRQLYRVLVVQRMVNSISNAIIPGSAPAQGGSGRASGGAVQAGRPYVTGEHGRELFVPSSSGRVLSVAQSKAAVAGGGGTSVVQNFNFAANGDESVKQLIAQAAPRIAKMTEKGILDSRRRGGQMKAVFG